MTKAIVPTTGTDLATDDEELREVQRRRFVKDAEDAIREGTPRNTVRAYIADMKRFEEWCAKQRPQLEPMPTTETALLGYLKSLRDPKPDEPYLRGGTIERRISGIVWAHAVVNIQNPVTPRVSKLLHAIKIDRVAKGEKPPRMAAPITLGDLRKMIRWVDSRSSVLTDRDRAMVLIGWCCAMRRSEIVALERQDISKISNEGFMLTIRRSKADQLGAGVDLSVTAEEDSPLCPVSALRRWLDVRGDDDGPLFWRTGWRKHGGRPIGDKQVARVVLNAVKGAELNPETKQMDFSAHSLRAGFITEAVRAGQHDRQVMERSRHKTHEVFLRYVRIVQTVGSNAATGFSKWGVPKD